MRHVEGIPENRKALLRLPYACAAAPGETGRARFRAGGSVEGIIVRAKADHVVLRVRGGAEVIVLACSLVRIDRA